MTQWEGELAVSAEFFQAVLLGTCNSQMSFPSSEEPMMKLKSVHIREFRCITDSEEIDVGDITCLVGKNESGKTALLQAIYRLNPVVPDHGTFDVTEDYPRAWKEAYLHEVQDKQREHATVIEARFSLDDSEQGQVTSAMGKVLRSPIVTLKKGYLNKLEWDLEIDEAAAVEGLVLGSGLPSPLAEKASKCATLTELHDLLLKESQAQGAAQKQAETLTDAAEKERAQREALSLAETSQAKGLREKLQPILKVGLAQHVWETLIQPKVPRFLYFDEYYQMTGQVNINLLKHRQQTNKLLDSDRPMLGLIELARLDLDGLQAFKRTEDLISNLEGVSNHLSAQVLRFWSQNKHIRIGFDVRQAMPEDPEGMREGVNVWGRVYDSVHEVSTPLGVRSKGFVWFFSFLAWFSQQKRKNQAMLLLLDEPGLVLHASGQADLLTYIESELAPHHQVVYTTHSPFMVDSQHFDRVKIIEDRSMLTDEVLPPEKRGTKVTADVLQVTEGSLFPLQGALGYDIAQSLFIGPNCLVVEGVSDLLYLQSMSALLRAEGKEGLSPKWVITPVGGAEKVPTFVALIGAQRMMNVATLIDIQRKDQQRVEKLYRSRLLKKKQVLTFADFVGVEEADMEDMFDVSFYIKLVNSEYADVLSKPISESALPSTPRRVVLRVGGYLEKNPLKSGALFNHYRPARYLAENIGTLKGEMSGSTLDRFEKVFKAVNGLLKA